MSSRRRSLLITLALIAVLFPLGLIFRVGPPQISVAPEPLFHLSLGEHQEFVITNSLFTTWIAMLILIVVSWLATRDMKMVPSGLQNFVELVIESLDGLIHDVAGNKGRKFFPVVVTIFLFVITSNWLGLLPGAGTIGIWEEHNHERVLVPLLRAPSSDVNMPLAVAIVSVFMTELFGIQALGFFNYTSRFVNVRRLVLFFKALVGAAPRQGMWGNLGFGVIDVFTGVIEFISEMLRLVSFTFRLFGNIFAGEVLLVVMAFLFPYLLPLPFYALEIFVGFIQAFVFALLTLVFMHIATIEHGGGEHAAHEASH